MAQPDLVIFDCDGVLIDSEMLANRTFIEMLSEYGIHMTSEEALVRYTGISGASIVADLESRYHINLPLDFNTRKRIAILRSYEIGLKPIPGIFNLLDAVPFKKCVASSGSPEGLRCALGLVGMWDHFAPYIFSAEQVKNGKPAPDLFLFAAEQMGVHPSACLVIEDSVAGVRAAKAANMRVFGFTGGSHCSSGHADVLRSEGAEQVFSEMKSVAKVLI